MVEHITASPHNFDDNFQIQDSGSGITNLNNGVTFPQSTHIMLPCRIHAREMHFLHPIHNELNMSSKVLE